ncbi:uncharacterized protein LOC131579945 [Poecile atricapillus]|uniref:uncharacterized protein LOC131579945 n=1 Tax=Poecile atricapillus TaxID=48891 RepID=UPI0027391BCF|nr:uncharacterized protein LOC131579945 [Poecile atricapillus]
MPSRQNCVLAGRFLSLFKVFRGKRKKDPGAAPAQHPEEPEQFQPLQDDAAMDDRQQQEPARGRFRKTLKMFTKFMCIRPRKTSTTATAGTAKLNSRPAKFQAEPVVSSDLTACSDSFDTAMNDHKTKTYTTEGMAITNTNTRMPQSLTNIAITPNPTVIHAPTMDFEETGFSFQQQVPAMVKNIHHRLESHVTVDVRKQIAIIRLADEHPIDVVLTLLRCAPSCDRAAALMWQTIASSGPTVEKVLPTLLCVMENWPLCSTCTSDGDNKAVFSLAATLALWVMVQMPQCREAMMLYSARLFVALLFQVVITTQQMPSVEFDSFWKACREQHRLPSNPNSL